MTYAHITGWGSQLPSNIITNHDLSKLMDTSDAWIQDKIGIKTRYIASSTETVVSMGTEAGRQAIQQANIDAKDVDLIIVATCSSETVSPSASSLIQANLGCTCGAVDLNAACSGFVYSLNLATSHIIAGMSKTILVIGSETMSRILNWEDRMTSVIFGDGAGAVVLQASEQSGGWMSSILGSDGEGGEALRLGKINNTVTPLNEHADAFVTYDPYLAMEGRAVFDFAIHCVSNTICELIKKAGLTLADIDHIIPHQSNTRIIQTVADMLGISVNRFHKNLEDVGNTSAASIPIALDDAMQMNKIKAGEKVIFVGYGAGLAWGASLFEWV